MLLREQWKLPRMLTGKTMMMLEAPWFVRNRKCSQTRQTLRFTIKNSRVHRTLLSVVFIASSHSKVSLARGGPHLLIWTIQSCLTVWLLKLQRLLIQMRLAGTIRSCSKTMEAEIPTAKIHSKLHEEILRSLTPNESCLSSRERSANILRVESSTICQTTSIASRSLLRLLKVLTPPSIYQVISRPTDRLFTRQSKIVTY